MHMVKLYKGTIFNLPHTTVCICSALQKDCRTPRRNRDVANALDYFSKVSFWCITVDRYLTRMMEFEQDSRPTYDGFFPKRDLSAINIKVGHSINAEPFAWCC